VHEYEEQNSGSVYPRELTQSLW